MLISMVMGVMSAISYSLNSFCLDKSEFQYANYKYYEGGQVSDRRPLLLILRHGGLSMMG